MIAIENGYKYQDLIVYMLKLIWKANGLEFSSLIFDNILKSRYNNDGDTILDALIKLKLLLVLNYLVEQNHTSIPSFLSRRDMKRINEAMDIKQKYLEWPKQ